MHVYRRYIATFAFASALAAATLISSGSARADVKIGVFGPFTGDAAATGKNQREGVDLAIKAKNATGGVLGQKIVAIYADDGGRPEQAVSVAKRLTASDQVLILIG